MTDTWTDLEDEVTSACMGKTEDQATAIAKAFGFVVRVTRINGKSTIVTRDHRLDRINVELVNERVAVTYVG